MVGCLVSLILAATFHATLGEPSSGSSACNGRCSVVEEEGKWQGEAVGSSASLLQKKSQPSGKRAVTEADGQFRMPAAPCQCETNSSDWGTPQLREWGCLFIDLGAADGNSYSDFLQWPAAKACPNHRAILVEANPRFSKYLEQWEKDSFGHTKAMASTAAYMCEGVTSFYLDTVDAAENYWGSSLSPDAADVQRSGKVQVTVPMVNLMRLIVENAMPEDYVVVKMDIEGAEWDILPCLAKSPAAKLIDQLYVEEHSSTWSLSNESTEEDWDAIMESLRASGMSANQHFSPTL